MWLIFTICPKNVHRPASLGIQSGLVVGLIVDGRLGIEGPPMNGPSVAVEGHGGLSYCVIVFCIILAIICSCSTWVWYKQQPKYHEACLTCIATTCSSNHLSSVFALSFTMHSICAQETSCHSTCLYSLDSKGFSHSQSRSSTLLSIPTLVSARCFFH